MNDCSSPLEAETVLGPVVAVTRSPGAASSRRVGSNAVSAATVGGALAAAASLMVACSNIAPNAATETFLGYSGTPDAGITATASATTIGNSTMTPGGPAVDCTAIVTVTRSASQSAGTIGTVYAVIGWDDSGGGTYVWSPNYVALTAAAQNLTLQYEFSHLAANAGHSKVTVAYANTSGVNATVSATPAHVQVEFIKR